MNVTRCPRRRSASASGRMRATWPRSPPSSQHITAWAISGSLRREAGDERPEVAVRGVRAECAAVALRHGTRFTRELLFAYQACEGRAYLAGVQRRHCEPGAAFLHRL